MQVRVQFCALDWRVVDNNENMGAKEDKYPYSLGWEFVGVVEAAGSNVTRFQPGQEVAGLMPEDHVKQCACAAYVRTFEGWLVRKPTQLSGAVVAAALSTGQLVYRTVYDKMKPTQGEGMALVLAATSACGSLAVQLLLKLDIFVLLLAETAEEAEKLRDMLGNCEVKVEVFVVIIPFRFSRRLRYWTVRIRRGSRR